MNTLQRAAAGFFLKSALPAFLDERAWRIGTISIGTLVASEKVRLGSTNDASGTGSLAEAYRGGMLFPSSAAARKAETRGQI